MPTKLGAKTENVALVGNPNTGKSTLFTALAGVRQQTGNYPGVTVERKTGVVVLGDRRVTLVDLPGTYSLAPKSPDEMVVVEELLGVLPHLSPPSAIICIADASNLARNLYLVSQVLELEKPTILVLNMTDVASRKGVQVDAPRLSERLGVPVILAQANKGVGIAEIRAKVAETGSFPSPRRRAPFPAEFESEVEQLQARLNEELSPATRRVLATRLLLDTDGYVERAIIENDLSSEGEMLGASARIARKQLADANVSIPAVEAATRYQWIGEILDGVVQTRTVERVTATDRIDRVLTHKVWGSLVFLALMLLTFQAVFAWAGPAMDGIEAAVSWVGDKAGVVLPDGPLRSLVVDGVIAGVGAVLVFLPQILLLFFFIAILEDCGYMARAAYLMDKLMSKVGLSGKSFIPLLSSFACAVPGIMATRVIENRRDRFVTILVAPLMSCSARLPVYTILIRAFIPEQTYFGGWIGLHAITMFAMYLVGMVVGVGVAWVLKKTFFAGPTPPFVMELPDYKSPSLAVVGRRLVDSGWAFVLQAGTLIFAVTVVVWAAAYFPRNAELEARYDTQIAAVESDPGAGDPDAVQARIAEIDGAKQGALLRQSYLGRAGQWIEPAVRPLGWDWRIGCAVIASFPAREVVIGTLGVIYNLGAEQDEESAPLRERLRSATWEGTDRPIFTVPVALSVMVFFALCAQCVATLAVIKRETNSWRWPIFSFTYMTALAYLGALLTYQIGTRWFS